jgi:hypothetical protein
MRASKNRKAQNNENFIPVIKIKVLTTPKKTLKKYKSNPSNPKNSKKLNNVRERYPFSTLTFSSVILFLNTLLEEDYKHLYEMWVNSIQYDNMDFYI